MATRRAFSSSSAAAQRSGRKRETSSSAKRELRFQHVEEFSFELELLLRLDRRFARCFCLVEESAHHTHAPFVGVDLAVQVLDHVDAPSPR